MPVDKQKRRRILIAEDEPMIAITLQELLVGAGFEIAGVAGKVENAVALIESDVCDGAILDANILKTNTKLTTFLVGLTRLINKGSI